jgi:rare lipoprotein A
MLHVDASYRFDRGRVFAIALMMFVAACASGPREKPVPPPDISKVPEPVPRAEPRSARGNPPFYEALGKRYFVMANAVGYVERGVASWYGPGFHAANTSNGEKYDMYGMTAAHKTLPLPSYVQVTNLQNGRSVVVRVNDRGPFKEGRIIDLSRTAAERLDMVRDGTAFVEVRAITPGAEPAPAAKGSQLYVQAGAFSSEANANRLRDQLKAQGEESSFVRRDTVGNRVFYRVRIGPVPSVQEFDSIVARLHKLGFPDARLASD